MEVAVLLEALELGVDIGLHDLDMRPQRAGHEVVLVGECRRELGRHGPLLKLVGKGRESVEVLTDGQVMFVTRIWQWRHG
jgi:hypothetical protein